MAHVQNACLLLLLLSSLTTLTELRFTKHASVSELSSWSDEELERPAAAASARAEGRSSRSLGSLLFGGGGGGGDGGGGDMGGGGGGLGNLSLGALFDMALSVLQALRHGAQVDVERARAAEGGYYDPRRRPRA